MTFEVSFFVHIFGRGPGFSYPFSVPDITDLPRQPPPIEVGRAFSISIAPMDTDLAVHRQLVCRRLSYGPDRPIPASWNYTERFPATARDSVVVEMTPRDPGTYSFQGTFEPTFPAPGRAATADLTITIVPEGTLTYPGTLPVTFRITRGGVSTSVPAGGVHTVARGQRVRIAAVAAAPSIQANYMRARLQPTTPFPASWNVSEPSLQPDEVAALSFTPDSDTITNLALDAVWADAGSGGASEYHWRRGSAGFVLQTAATTTGTTGSTTMGRIASITVRAPDLGASHQLAADAHPPGALEPRTRIAIAATVHGPNNTQIPAPDGTQLKVRVRSPGNGNSSGQGASSLWLSGSEITSGQVSVRSGHVDVELRCSSRADGWIARLPTAANPSRLRPVVAANYAVEVESLDGSVRAESPVITIVAGKPHRIELIDGLEDVGATLGELVAPNGLPMALRQPVARVRELPFDFVEIAGGPLTARDLDIRLGTTDVYTDPGAPRPTRVPAGTAALIITLVVDAHQNPCPVQEGTATDGYQCRVRITDWLGLGLGTMPFVLSASGVALDPQTTVWVADLNRANAFFPFPRGVWTFLLVPSFGFVTISTDLAVEVTHWQNGAGTVVASRVIPVESEPSGPLAEVSKWFFDGEVNSFQALLAEIGISLIPIIGDGRDILIYLRNELMDRPMDDIDRVVAALAVIGLLLDLANVASVGGTIAADAAIAVLKAGAKLLRTIRRADLALEYARAFRHMLQQLPPLPGPGSDWPATPGGRALLSLVEDLRRVAARMSEPSVTIEKIKTFHALAGIMVAGAALRPMLRDLLKLFDRHTLDEILDMMLGIAKLDEQDTRDVL